MDLRKEGRTNDKWRCEVGMIFEQGQATCGERRGRKEEQCIAGRRISSYV